MNLKEREKEKKMRKITYIFYKWEEFVKAFIKKSFSVSMYSEHYEIFKGYMTNKSRKQVFFLRYLVILFIS